ncbi:LOW QUALITY PROTEIN: DNA endonuclease RBBP8 [Fundulus heteroclitus]|uniref:LOW QUALITY PROTEIN: DNA endonuclease RBBP8 n=1 Tax=Fundulus heteroclitus TaxID=8078 RepID=UPI00165C262E|nr:LOW QUALITY PROTEIN: DNA endonuclease RBBP8 [Fundulus heteroclitus]
MNSPGDRSDSARPTELFEELCRQLKECHQNAVQEFEAKVSKLKKERCLDAQRLEVFYNRNQQLKEQSKILQDTVSLLEERVRAGECDRCAVLKEKLRSSQDQNLDVICKLKDENKNLEDENRNLRAELQKMKTSQCCVCIRAEPGETSLQEPEDAVIPDSPIFLPVANKLRKRQHSNRRKHVRYAETPLQPTLGSLFSELKKESDGGAKNFGRGGVLVPNTCELDASQSSNETREGEGGGGGGGDGCRNLRPGAARQPSAENGVASKSSKQHRQRRAPQRSFKASWTRPDNIGSVCCFHRQLKIILYLSLTLRPLSSSFARIPSPDSTTARSPSLLPSIKCFSEEASVSRAKRKKEEGDCEVQGGGKAGVKVGVANQRDGEPLQPVSISQTAAPVCDLSLKTQQLDNKDPCTQRQTPNQKLDVSCASPAFKKPRSKATEEAGGRRRPPLQDGKRLPSEDADRKPPVEPTWSIDPALALSMYESQQREDQEEEKQRAGELADTDCTWVSHSMLQRRGEGSQGEEDMKPGLGEKANDSLDRMFDATTFGEYKSYNCSHLDPSQHSDDEEEEDDVREDVNDQDRPEAAAGHSGARQPTFAHVAVVRKKDERRKLKGTTCKECEVYYAHLPEEEKQQKLSSCSRHRYLYIPPSTPENFWEVGFPSTQTCIDRGYIKEEKKPQARSRRRQPLNALFSPKQGRKQS